MTAAELRAKIRALMAPGVPPAEPPLIHRVGEWDAGTRMGAPKPRQESCTDCGELGAPGAYFYVADLVVRVHAACDALWKQERIQSQDRTADPRE